MQHGNTGGWMIYPGKSLEDSLPQFLKELTPELDRALGLPPGATSALSSPAVAVPVVPEPPGGEHRKPVLAPANSPRAAWARRIALKRGQKMIAAVETMVASFSAYEAAVKRYSAALETKAAGGYADAARLAKATGQTKEQVVARVMDLSDRDPSLAPLRTAFSSALEDQEVEDAHRAIFSSSCGFRNAADIFLFELGAVASALKPVEGMRAAAAGMAGIFETHLARRATALGEVPAPDKSWGHTKPKARIQSSMVDILTRIASVAYDVEPVAGKTSG
jgi:hypothetical protein